MSEGWLKFPRVIIFYIPLYGMAAVPMFIADSGNPARALGWAMWLWGILTISSTIIAVATAAASRIKDKNSEFFPTFHITFFVTWMVVFVGVLMLASN